MKNKETELINQLRIVANLFSKFHYYSISIKNGINVLLYEIAEGNNYFIVEKIKTNKRRAYVILFKYSNFAKSRKI